MSRRVDGHCLPMIAALAFAALLLPAGARPAAACSCVENPPCAALWSADAVFVGTVVDEVWENVGGSLHWITYKVVALRPLHGTVDPIVTFTPHDRPSPEQIEATTSRGMSGWVGSSCDFTFKVGQQYIIYARRTADGRWTTSLCSGTKLAEKAADDLDYIASLPAAEPTGRIYGAVSRHVVDPRKPGAYEVKPASGVTVALTGAHGRLTTTTDSEGRLDVEVPPGDYTVAPAVPETV